jgi:hypothetical protein
MTRGTGREHDSSGRERTLINTGKMAVGLPAVAAATLVVLLLLGATAAASSVFASTVRTAPYAGAANQDAFWSDQGCNTSFSVSKLPEFSLSKGTFVGREAASATTCGASNSSMFGEIQGSYATSEFTVTNGSYAVAADWAIKDSISLAATSGAGGITAGSYAIVGAYAELEDVTNGTTWVFGDASTFYLNSTSPSTHSHSYALGFNTTLHLVAGQHYELVTGIYAEVNTFVNGAKSSATASVNLGSSGKKATLTSVEYP